jgi:DNA modification methylase
MSSLSSSIFNQTPINRKEISQNILDINDKKRSNSLPWKGQFSPQLIESLIQEYATSNGFIFDPFLGSGTVLLEAGRYGVSACGTDINPGAFILSNLYKFINISENQRNIYVKKFLSQLDFNIFNIMNLPIFQDQEWNTYFNIQEKLKELLDKNSEEEYVIFLYQALIVLLDFNRKTIDSQKIFEVARIITNFILDLPYSQKSITVYNTDARKNPLPDSIVDLIITSPPYINVFNYHQQYRISAEFLGWKILELAKSEFGSNRKHRSNRFLTVIQYCLDISATLQELLRICKYGSRLILIVGRESNICKIPFYNGELVAELAYQVFNMPIYLRQERKFMNRYGKIIKEDILHFKKDNRSRCNFNSHNAKNVAIQALELSLKSANESLKQLINEAIANSEKIQSSPIYYPQNH